MRAMILAAGLGTRLQPLTDTRPKALVEIAGRTLLEITLSRLCLFGVTEAIVNVHHFADMVVDYLKANNNFGMRTEISREEMLLDTGGGLKKAAWFFLEDPRRLDEPFVLHNVDVLSSIDLRRMLKFHNEHQALATLAVQSRESSRLLLFNEQLELRGRRVAGKDTIADEATVPTTNPTASQPLQALAFSGVHIISPRLLPMLREEAVFSIIPEYVRVSAEGQKILGFRSDEYYWRDLGRPPDLAQATGDLQQKLL